MKMPRPRISIVGLMLVIAVASAMLGLWRQWVMWPSVLNTYRDLCRQRPSTEVGQQLTKLIREFPALANEPDVMIYAAIYGDLDLCRNLLKRGVPLNEVNAGDYTPFYYALQRKQTKFVIFMIEHGVDPTSPDSIGGVSAKRLSPLHHVARSGNLEMCRLLVDLGIDIDSETKDGDRPLRCALSSGDPEIVEFFLDHGATFREPMLPYDESIRYGYDTSFQGPTGGSDMKAVIEMLEERLPHLQLPP